MNLWSLSTEVFCSLGIIMTLKIEASIDDDKLSSKGAVVQQQNRLVYTGDGMELV